MTKVTHTDVARLTELKQAFERDAESCGALHYEQLQIKQNGEYQLAQTQAMFVLYCAAVAEGANRVIKAMKKKDPGETNVNS